MTIEQKLKMVLAFSNVSQAELARRIGTTPSNLNQKVKRNTLTNEELEQKIHSIDEMAGSIKNSSDEVAVRMKQINDNTQQNCVAVEQVTASSQENTAGTESLAEIVEQIRVLSEKLNDVVRG